MAKKDDYQDFTIAISSNENRRKTGTPWKFHNYYTISKYLETGDYTLEGFEHEFAIDRKTQIDFYSSIGGDSERFRKELERLSTFKRKFIIVESSFEKVIKDAHPKGINFKSKSFSPEKIKQLHVQGKTGMGRNAIKGIIAQIELFYGVSVFFAGNRELAEKMALRFLSKYYKYRRMGFIK